MLVLSRRLNETIVIGDNIRITLLGIEGDKIKLGIDAPRSTRIVREELIEGTKSSNVQALNAPAGIELSKLREAAEEEQKT